MQGIARIIYVPTLACNCHCAHCGQQRLFEEAECDCGLIQQRLLESRCFESGLLSFTGGEPFLKQGLPAMLAAVCSERKWDIDITTNGICTEAIRSFCEAASPIGDKKVSFSISIDGMPEVHNQIRQNAHAFEKASETLKLLQSVGAAVKVNTVIQQGNSREMDEFALFMAREYNGVEISWIPEILEINGRDGFPYTQAEAEQILPRITDAAGRAYLETSGATRIKDCHAGIRTCVIAPSGKVYACLTGFSYKGMGSREKFCIGDLKDRTLDEIFTYCQDADAPYRKAVRGCSGCWNPCEVGNELNFWGMDMEQMRAAGCSLLDPAAVVVPGTTIPPDLVWGNVPAKPLKRATGGQGIMDEVKLDINVEKIMEEIREQIRREEGMVEIPSFDEIPVRGENQAGNRTDGEADWPQLLASLQYVNNGYDIPYYWSFGPNSLKTFAKRVVRKLLKCLIAPILAMQNAFNAHVVRCLNQLRYFAESILAQLEGNRQELDGLRQRILHHDQELRELERQFQEQEDRLLSWMTGEIRRVEQEAQDHAQMFLERATDQEEIIQLRERIQEMENSLRLELAAVSREAAEVRAALEDNGGELCQNIEILRHRSDEMQIYMEKHIARQDEVYQELRRRIELLDRQSDAFSASVAKTILSYKTENGIPVERSAPQTRESMPKKECEDTYTALNYFKFQNDFRGTRSQISERQAMYLTYFRGSTGPVLDIGCGRGELLHILKEENIPAFGIDLYPEYVVEGELSGLDVRQGDGIAFLKEADMRFGGIFAAHVVEHISFADLQTLCFAAYEKLVPGGYLILETPNPTCLSTFSNAFYVDPTHIKPVHPVLLAYMLREAGFSEVQTVYTEASRAGTPLPLIDSDGIRNLDEVNHAIERVSNLLYGSQDYAVVAKR